MHDDVLLSVDNVCKKFCRSLKRSMRYGVADIFREVVGKPAPPNLRDDEFWAVKDVSFEVRAGECLGIIGPNGAGKSTILKMLNGIFMPDRGSITADSDMAALIEVGAGFHPLLSGRENVYINGAILGASKKKIDKTFDEIVSFAELEEFIDSPVKHYSSGMYVRLGFAVAACLAPRLLLLDEVLAVGDMRFRHKCFRHVKQLIKGGTGVVFISHSMTDLLRVTRRAVVLDSGCVQFDGATEEGIAVYQRCLSSRNNTHGHVEHSNVRITNIELLDASGLPTERIRTGDDLWLVFDLPYAEGEEFLEFRFVIESSEYGEIATLSSVNSEIEIRLDDTVNRYGFRVQNIPLLRGYYQIHAHFFKRTDGVYLDSQLNIIGFHILGGDFQAPYRHLLKLPQDWCKWDDHKQRYSWMAHAESKGKTPSQFNG